MRCCNFSYFLLISNLKNKKLKKIKEKGRRFGGCNGSTNKFVIEPWIDKNWNLEDWIDKIESYRTEMKKCES